MRGEATPVQIAALLMGLRAKGETADEVAGAAHGAPEGDGPPRHGMDGDRMVDTCGTGGGRVGTINISTAAAFVVAGAGVRVAKHGNRSFTSRSGSADVLEALGVEITLSPERARRCSRRRGRLPLRARVPPGDATHRARFARSSAIPTIMNLLGPLANPAGVRRQVIGVSDARGRPSSRARWPGSARGTRWCCTRSWAWTRSARGAHPRLGSDGR